MKQALIFVILTTAALVVFDEPQMNQDESLAKAVIYPDQRGLNTDDAEALS